MKKGTKHTNDALKKMSAAHSGKNHHNYGKPLPEITRIRISKSQLGEKNHRFGKPLSEECIKNLIKINTGNKYRVGKKLSAEHKEKISAFSRGRKFGEEARKNMSSAQKGKTLSMETRKKISISKTGKRESEDIRKKKSISQRGENGSNWRGGINSIRESFRKNIEYRLWRETIFKRDNFTCVACSLRGGKINADHIKPFAVILNENNISTLEEALKCEELWDINNGQTLCTSCHKLKTKADWKLSLGTM